MERKKHTWDGLFSWICWISMLVFTVSSPEPKITGCELLEHANITCYWTAHSSEIISYVMRVNTSNCVNNKISMDSCNTTYTHCSVKIGSVSHCFCVDVLIFTSSRSTRLPPYCFNGINEVKMYAPHITLVPRPENSSCLKLRWEEPQSRHMPYERNQRVLQIEYHTLHGMHFPKVNAVLHDWQMDLCGLSPGTKHLVRVRAQDLRAKNHWSSWSVFAEATTAEAAPAAAPELWRLIQPIEKFGQRRIILLWKPLQWPYTNGMILRYAASCWDQLHSSHWDCGHLDSYSTSCTLFVSTHACTCNLTAFNSAGTSPTAHVYIPGDKDAELRAPENLSVNPLDDFHLKVDWTATVNQSESSFIIEWFPVPDATVVGLSWKILNGSEKSFIITGVHPEVAYNVSVRILYKNTTAGAAGHAIAFTKQGVPSVGPKLEVLQTTTNDLILMWQPVPLEKLHGFIQNYTVLYKYKGQMKSRVLSGATEQLSLSRLSPGVYAMCVKAHTLAGGAESSWVTVTIGSEDIPVTAIVLCTIGSLLILFMMLTQAERIQQCLCPVIPDPSKSSLSTWPLVSPHQHKLPIIDCKQPFPLYEPICMGEGIIAHRDHHHHEDSKLQSFSPQTSKQACKQVSSPAELTFREPNKLKEELTIDLSYQNGNMETPQWCHHVPSSFSERPDPGIAMVDSVFFKSNIVPRLESSYERLETLVSSDVPTLPKSCVRMDTLDPDDLFYRRSPMSKLNTFCYAHVSTSYLPVADSYIDLTTVAENSTNLIHRSNHFSRWDSTCCGHVSDSCLPVPEPLLAYADYVTVNTADFQHQSSQIPKKRANGYIHVSTSYLPFQLTHSESDFCNSVDENNPMSGLKSCIYKHIQTNYQKSCPDLEVEDMYRPLSAEECPHD